jgi:hypothetical protein
VVKIYHGAPHGFIGFPPGTIKSVQEVLDDTEAFVRAKMGFEGGFGDTEGVDYTHLVGA